MQMNQEDLMRMNKVVRHRLRNSASGLKASVTFLSKELSDRLSPQEQEYFPLILNECDAITFLTNRMQQLFDPIALTSEIRVEEALSLVVEKIRNRFPTALIEQGSDEAAMVATVCQQQSLLVPLEELLVNAIEVTPQTAVVLSVRLVEGMLEITVVDEGPGANEICEDPILPFCTTKTRHLGVGLTVTQRLLTHVGGTVDLASSESGTMVRLRYPYDSVSGWYGISEAPAD